MSKKIVQKSIFLFLIVTFLSSLFIIVGASNILQNIVVDSSEKSQLAYNLFQMEPTNPTQVLKARMNSKLASSNDPITKPISPADAEGDVNSFWTIASFASYPYVYTEITAKLLSVGTHCYVYVASSIISAYTEAAAKLTADDYQFEFDTNIYPSDTLYFGDPDGTMGDIDGNPKVTILLLSLDGGVAGYFDPANEFSDPGPSGDYRSNARELVYIDYANTLAYGLAVLTHEMQHLIHYNSDSDELWWVDEGCSTFSEYAAGYWQDNDNLTYFAENYFSSNPEDSLIYWNYDGDGGYNTRIDYGSAYMFIFYLAEKYGVDVITNLVSETANSATGIEHALTDEGFSITFNELYLNWITALAIDDTGFDDGLYGFENLNFDMDSASNIDLVSSVPYSDTSANLHRFYGFHIAKITSISGSLMFEIDNPSSYAVGISIAVHDTHGWHVNQSIRTDSGSTITEFIQGESIDTVYVLTSMISSSTPLEPTDQFGLGPTDYLDYSLNPGNPLTIEGTIQNYSSGNWNFSVVGIQISDENGTEINATSEVTVYVEFKREGNISVYDAKNLTYSEITNWTGIFNLQDFHEDTYEIRIIAEGGSAFGVDVLDTIVIEHIIAVNKPILTLSQDKYLLIDASATYTQINGWSDFISNASVRAVLYQDPGTPVKVLTMNYNSSSDGWTSEIYDYSTEDSGDYYVTVTIKYAGRSVDSENSDMFEVVTEPTEPTNTNRITSPFIFGLSMLSIAVVIQTIRKRGK